MDSKLIFEKTIFLKPLYFKNKESLLGFIENLHNLIFSNVDENNQIVIFTLKTEFGKISSNNLSDFKGIINQLKSIYYLKLILKHKIKIEINLNEFDTIKNYSFIKIFGNNLKEITLLENKIREELIKYKNRFNFVRKEFFQALITIILVLLTIYYNFKFNESFISYIIMIFSTIFYIFLVKLLGSIFVPSFKLNTKTSLFKKIQNYYIQRKDSFIMWLIPWLLPLLISIIIAKR